jgi:hypothetical protein
MRRKAQPAASAAEPAPPSPPPPFVIELSAVYRPAAVIAALGLRASSLRSEWRAGRLRIVKRCGKNYLLGRDVLAWLDGGELPAPTRQPRVADEPAA